MAAGRHEKSLDSQSFRNRLINYRQILLHASLHPADLLVVKKW